MTQFKRPPARRSGPVFRRPLIVASLLFCAAGSGLATGLAQRDVLDAPATLSAQALRGPTTSVAARGERAVAVGPRGTILVSRDSGQSWTQVPAPLSADLTAVRFGHGAEVWAVGHDAVVLRSDDLGDSWSRVLDGRGALAMVARHYRERSEAGDEAAADVLWEVENAARQSATPDVLPEPFLDVWMDEHGEGFVAGAFGFLLHTVDHGKTWEPWIERADNDRRLHLYALTSSPDGQLYLAGEQGYVSRYDREAKRFTRIETPYNGTFFGLTATATQLIAFGLRGNAFVSRDQAASWSALELDSEASVVATLSAGAGRLVFVTQSGRVLVGDDDGARISDAGIARSGEILSAAMLGPDRVALARVNGISVVGLPAR